MKVLKLLKPVIVKEFRQLRRDRTSLGMLLGLPSVLIIMVGYALNFDVKHVPLVILDQNKTEMSRSYLEKFKHSEYFRFTADVANYREIEEDFLDGRSRIAVVVPAQFGQDLLSGKNVKVQILVDGADANTAGQAVANAVRLTVEYSTRMTADAYRRIGREAYQPVDFEPRVWYNPDLVSSRFLVPGLLGFIIVLTAVVSTSMTVVREKERGTMEQIMVSPLNPAQVIIGKTIPYLLISLIAASGILFLGYLLFDIQVAGSILLLYAAIVIIILGALGQGLLISTVTDSQQVAFLISVFSSLLPSFLLSGFVFPVASMPLVLQVVSYLAVNKYFLAVVRGIMLKGVGFTAVWEQFLFMALFAVLMLGVSILRMRKRAL